MLFMISGGLVMWNNGTVEYGCKQAWSDPEAGVVDKLKRKRPFAQPVCHKQLKRG